MIVPQPPEPVASAAARYRLLLGRGCDSGRWGLRVAACTRDEARGVAEW